MTIQMFATCPEEIKSVLKQELKEQGAQNIKDGYRAVYFSVSDEKYYKCHLKLSTASNLFRVLKECSAKSEAIIFSQAKRIKWHKIFDRAKGYRVDGIAGDRGQDALSSNAISKCVRQAIEDDFLHFTNEKPKVDLKDPQVIVTVFVYKGRAMISLKTSGKSLHKRSYRLAGHPAPLKETMAAALLRLSGYDGSMDLLDPMCGSGTIAIEAAMIATNKSCNIHRKKGQFGFEHLLDFNSNLWRGIQDQCRKEKKDLPEGKIFASDINQDYLDGARNNALRARVEKYIDFELADFTQLHKPSEKGLIICNLPYGERLSVKGEDLETFYKTIGDVLKNNFAGWKACLFVNEQSPWKRIGLKPSRKINLLNGSIKTKLLTFDLYEGRSKP